MVSKEDSKIALKKMKEDYGGASPELMETYKFNRKLLKDAEKAIRELGTATTPEVAEKAGISTDNAFFAINALMRYYGLKLVNKRGEYPQYSYEEAH